MKTAGPAARIALTPDRAEVRGDGTDLVFVTATIQDAAGVMVPRAHDRLTFTVDGPARIVATDNGDPTSMEAFGSPAREAFNGLVLVILRANHDASGTIRITAAGEGLGRGTAEVRISRSNGRR